MCQKTNFIMLIFIAVIIITACKSSNTPEIGSIEHLNTYENDYLNFISAMKKYQLSSLHSEEGGKNTKIKDLFHRTEVHEVHFVDSTKKYYFSVGVMETYIYVDNVAGDTLKLFHYKKSKLIKIKPQWYYNRRPRFGSVD